MFELHVLPAAHGDALVLSWAANGAPRHHLLIDAGPDHRAVQEALDARLSDLGIAGGRLELLVITHIDADHIGGVTRLLKGDEDLPFDLGEVWFNGFRHLPPDDLLGEAQAEEVSEAIERRGLGWNSAFGGEAVVVPDEPDVDLPSVPLPGGLRVTVLGPTRQRLADLRPDWEEWLREADILPGAEPTEPEPEDTLGDEEVDVDDLDALAETPFVADPSEPNAASIVLLAEFGGDAVLLTGDALAEDILDGLRRLTDQRGEPVTFQTLKLPHHGSRANVSTELVEALPARRHVVSSNGRQYDHPDPEAIARIIVSSPRGVELCFNHRSPESDLWDDDDLRAEHGYRSVHPDPDADGIVIDLTAPILGDIAAPGSQPPM